MCLIAGSGGAPTANFAGGAAVAKTAREQSSMRRSKEAAQESEGGNAAGATDEGERVEGEAGQARELGWAKAKVQRGVEHGPASAGGPEGRRRPVKGENPFSNSIFKEFPNISFQIPF